MNETILAFLTGGTALGAGYGHDPVVDYRGRSRGPEQAPRPGRRRPASARAATAGAFWSRSTARPRPRALGIDGLGEKIVVQLVELGLIEDFADLFTLTRDQILSLERMGERSTDTLLVALLGRLTGERGVDVPNPVVV
ncbi:hypothetical protein [Streptacidiphilus carbonis]|uniref:hypothetical protein n=1 Tax=Streptacidiphilus carbonis TaxID=105422 RepID=UPI00126A3641|nr:hypothetical protein [Streptacidiphilus carbonis]